MLTLNLKTWIDLARREIVPIALFFAIALLMLAFAEITDEVTEGEGEVRWLDEGSFYAEPGDYLPVPDPDREPGHRVLEWALEPGDAPERGRLPAA